MAAIATPLFAGDLHDTALRLAQARPVQRPGSADDDALATWRQMLDLGWQGVLVAEESGGAGADLSDFAAIVEALATRALSLPLIDRCAVAPALLGAAAARPAARALLETCASGNASVAPALHVSAQHHAAKRPLVHEDGRLRGSVVGADWSVPATHLLFDARSATDDAPVLVLLDAAAVSARLRRYVGIDGRICADIAVEGVVAQTEHLLLRGADATRAIDTAQQLASLLGCVSIVGACGAMIEQTIEYLNTREQFGTPLATFQALRRRVVEMYVAYENARGLVRDQVLQHARAPDGRQVALTRLYVQQVGRTVGESTIQLHGGMGMSQETLAARLSMHALMAGLQFGDRSSCLDWLAADFAPAPPAAERIAA